MDLFVNLTKPMQTGLHDARSILSSPCKCPNYSFLCHVAGLQGTTYINSSTQSLNKRALKGCFPVSGANAEAKVYASVGGAVLSCVDVSVDVN